MGTDLANFGRPRRSGLTSFVQLVAVYRRLRTKNYLPGLTTFDIVSSMIEKIR